MIRCTSCVIEFSGLEGKENTCPACLAWTMRTPVDKVLDAEQARELAIDWQQLDIPMTYDHLIDWADYFTTLANKYDLTDEFRENGII